MSTFRILSIDAWADAEPGAWTWNAWYERGTIDSAEFAAFTREEVGYVDANARTTERARNRRVLQWFRENGYTSQFSRGRLTVEDDGYNIVVMDRRTSEPLFAIEYGAEESQA